VWTAERKAPATEVHAGGVEIDGCNFNWRIVSAPSDTSRQGNWRQGKKPPLDNAA